MNDKYLPNNQPKVICQVTKQTKNISFMLRLITEGRGSYDYAKNLGWKCLQKYWTAEIHIHIFIAKNISSQTSYWSYALQSKLKTFFMSPSLFLSKSGNFISPTRWKEMLEKINISLWGTYDPVMTSLPLKCSLNWSCITNI